MGAKSVRKLKNPRTYALVNTCKGSFESCLKLLQNRTIIKNCSDAPDISLTLQTSICM